MCARAHVLEFLCEQQIEPQVVRYVDGGARGSALTRRRLRRESCVNNVVIIPLLHSTIEDCMRHIHSALRVCLCVYTT